MNTVTQNACKQCSPLGASLVFKGLENTMCILHGSQGCATYIRRYLISHYREPIDIASSSFTEETAVFGGHENLKKSITNVISSYKPKCIGIASTCLSETIGEDTKAIVNEYYREHEEENVPEIICVSTPSYSGTHTEGFNKTVLACVKHFAGKSPTSKNAAVFPGMISPADIRHLKNIASSYFDNPTVFPDYSDTLDGGLWKTYHPIPSGGTTVETLKSMGYNEAAIEFSSTGSEEDSAGKYLYDNFGVTYKRTHIPIGVNLTDNFITILGELTNKRIPDWIEKERSRLLDLYTDGHKYIFGKRVLIYGDEDLVSSLFAFCQETGLFPVLCCSGNKSGGLKKSITALKDNSLDYETVTLDDVDFDTIEETACGMNIDLMIGNSKGYKLSNKLNVPLIRAGFPIHDRIGAGHINLIGYFGALQLFEKIVNTFIKLQQQSSTLQYGYI